MATDTKKATKRPSALKRQIQSEKRRLRNRSQRSAILTAIRKYNSALAEKQPQEELQAKLNAAYSLIDKGVKTSIHKANKAARTKSRLAARLKAS